MVLTGLTMSPSMDATWPWLLDLFGGRQSARSIHFIAAGAARALRRRAPGHGGAGRPVQRDPLDDHRPLPPAEGEAAMPRLDHPPPLLTAAGLAAPALAARRLRLAGREPELPRPRARLRRVALLPGAAADRSRGAGARVRPRRDVAAASAPTATPMPRSADVPAPRRRRLRRLAARVDGLVEAPRACSLAELRAHAGAQPDHPARLRRGLERDRQVDRRAARRRCSTRRACGRRRAIIVFHCADDFRGTGPTTRASTSSTPSTRRRSSPTA